MPSTRDTPIILIVDDNITNLKVMVEHLKGYHYEILTANNGADGLKRAQLGQPDLILLDIQMPGMDGLETCRRLKANPETAALPVIFMTALSDPADKIRGLEAGGVDYLTKPYEATEALARIRTHLTIAQLRRDLLQKNETLHSVNEALEEKVRARTEDLMTAQTALAKAHHQLQELDRLKSAFLGVITHELRSPFVNIDLSLQLLEHYGVGNLMPEQREQLQQLDSAVGAARLMIENLVKVATFFSHQGELHVTPINFGSLIENALLPIRLQAQRRQLTISIRVPDDLPVVYGDEERLYEAIYHLAHNAIKFTPDGGKIALCCWIEAAWINLEVIDSGVGIPADRLSTLWESFTQMADPLQRGQEGLGLGLALVKYVVAAHGGSVWAYSREGVGSTFGFRLPLSQPEAQEHSSD